MQSVVDERVVSAGKPSTVSDVNNMLPDIPLPKFTGVFAGGYPFKLLSLVIEDILLSVLKRLHCLRSSLRVGGQRI